MMTKPLIFTEIEFDALRETGNVGAGRAATALSRLLGRQVHIDVPRASVISLEEFPALVGGTENVVAAVYFTVLGEAPGRLVLVVEAQSLGPLLTNLLGHRVESTTPLSDESASAMKELGNIVCGNYLNAMSELVGFPLLPSVPALAVDMAGSVLESVAADAAQCGSQALLLESRLLDWGQPLPLYLFYLPEPDALDSLLAGLARSTGVDLSGGRV